MFCGNCGKPIAYANAKFCPACGAPVRVQPDAANEPPKVPVPPRPEEPETPAVPVVEPTPATVGRDAPSRRSLLQPLRKNCRLPPCLNQNTRTTTRPAL